MARAGWLHVVLLAVFGLIGVACIGGSGSADTAECESGYWDCGDGEKGWSCVEGRTCVQTVHGRNCSPDCTGISTDPSFLDDCVHPVACEEEGLICAWQGEEYVGVWGECKTPCSSSSDCPGPVDEWDDTECYQCDEIEGWGDSYCFRWSTCESDGGDGGDYEDPCGDCGTVGPTSSTCCGGAFCAGYCIGSPCC